MTDKKIAYKAGVVDGWIDSNPEFVEWVADVSGESEEDVRKDLPRIMEENMRAMEKVRDSGAHNMFDAQNVLYDMRTGLSLLLLSDRRARRKFYSKWLGLFDDWL